MKIQVGTAAQYQDIDAGATLLAVPYEIIGDDESVLQERIQSFPLETTQDDITAFLNRSLQVYKDKVATHESAKALQIGLDNSSEVAAEISGITIND